MWRRVDDGDGDYYSIVLLIVLLVAEYVVGCDRDT